MSDWKVDKQWSDRFLPEIKAILGTHLIGEPPAEEDAERNTDLIVLRMEAVRIACRVRQFEYLARYGDEFTIRADRPSGAKTELTKIVEGWGDYFFYGFSDEGAEHLARWTLGSLNVFRLWFMRSLAAMPAGTFPGARRHNGDGSSSFLVFRIRDLPREFVIAQKTAAMSQENMYLWDLST